MPLDSHAPPPDTAAITSSGPIDILKARFLRAGAGALRNHELLTLLLRGTHAPDRATTLATRLLDTFGSLPRVLSASPHSLGAVPGLDKDALCTIKIAETLGILLAGAALPECIDTQCSNYRAVVDYCRTRIGFKPIEEFHILFLDNRNHLLRAELHQTGTVNRAPAYTREIVHRALQLHASAFILVHNHPAGDPTPSRADIETTRKIKAAADLFGIRLHDHIIVTPSRDFSFHHEGRLHD